ncbi:MAG: hypothetical protein JSS26_16585 [Nitrospira sp.]|nr:hypothetical protein [Nitrospira sp.]
MLAILERDFEMSQVLGLLENSPDRPRSKRYLHDLPFHFVATQQQGKMIIDAYAVGDFNSLVVGYSLFYYGQDGYLASAALSVNPMNESAKQKAIDLIERALDSVSSPDGSTLHFLGIYDWDNKRVLKIMIRKRQTSIVPDYDIEYAVSYR